MTKPKQKLTIAEKIKALLALATSPNENEAASAMEKAQELLAKHNLSMKDVTSAEAADRFKISHGKVGDVFAHKRQLGHAIGKLYFCKYFYSVVAAESKGGNVYKREQHCFAGEPHNLDIAVMMFDYLVTTIDRLAKEAADQMEDKKKYWSFQTAFKTAAAHRVATRVMEKIQACTAPTVTGGKLPALASLYERADSEVSEFLASQLNLQAGKVKKQLYDAAGLRAGRIAGDSIGLDAQIGGGTNTTHLLS